ncbi:alpha/beta-hydrolase [Wolfiporia cocos MD-104 SS10]|uniref:Alpha/beta-hydrolase n=1 Tax=Wolfiporia cocos (strain MD-104) TaxID=742152 RepID=A0A2H3JJQ0_WOLCO|nr:alpha/beta-hydrolase [Wolfiporia cocos MD-104 SS10]
MRLSYLVPLCLALGIIAADEDVQVSFRPQDLPQKTVSCKALNRAEDLVKDIDIHYVEVNPEAERTLLMVHGWPSLWHSWKFQIEEFKDDYHIVAPDLRGFGSSAHPGDVKTSGNWADIVGDLVCVLDHAGIDSAVCMGHDWGSELCYQAARMRPDLIHAIVGAAVPYISFAGPFQPTSALAPYLPQLAYQVFLGTTPEQAKEELDTDIRRSLRATLRTVASPTPDTFLTATTTFLGPWGDAEIPPIPFFTSEEEDYWVEQYSIQGFKNTLQFYTPGNQEGSWNFIHAQGNLSIPQPALSILPLHDPVADWAEAAKIMRSADFVPSLTTQMIEGAHWLQLENPCEFNRIARTWLEALPYKEKIAAEEAEKKKEEAKEAKEQGYVEPEVEVEKVQVHLGDEL